MGSHPLPSDKPTIAYLPHCPRELYEAFLAANWEGEGKMFGWSGNVEGEGPVAVGDDVWEGECDALGKKVEGGLKGSRGGKGGRHVVLANVFMDYVDK